MLHQEGGAAPPVPSPAPNPSSPSQTPPGGQHLLCPGLLETLLLVWIIPRGMQGGLFQLELHGKVIQPIPKVISLFNTCLSVSKGEGFICRVGARESIPHSSGAAPQVNEWHGDREWQGLSPAGTIGLEWFMEHAGPLVALGTDISSWALPKGL